MSGERLQDHWSSGFINITNLVKTTIYVVSITHSLNVIFYQAYAY